jgi:2-polyprenyl-6-hydroxyphenyl methylase/3-demethylubiquinone-9 3-methyltransferase
MELRSDYGWKDAAPSCAHPYLWPTLKAEIAKLGCADRRVFDLGCGNGATANMLSVLGFAVTGIDPSRSGIAHAKAAYPHVTCEVADAYERLSERFGTFPLLVSLEVVEHVYAPRVFAKTAFDLLEPGGVAIMSTPYHGYLKNLAIALTGSFDRHVDPLNDGGHIKFWSRGTLRVLLEEAGFRDVSFLRVGRIPPLAKSMMAVCRKP